MARKKLLYVARPQSGGMLKHLRTLTAHFSVQWDISVAAPSMVLIPVNKNGGNLKLFKLSLVGSAAPLRDLFVSVQLVKICRQEKIELLHAHGFKAAFITLPAAKICGLPLIITVHNSLLHSEKSIFPAAYYYRALRGVDPLVTGYIAISEALRQELVAWGIDRSKIARIYNGINPREFGVSFSNGVFLHQNRTLIENKSLIEERLRERENKQTFIYNNIAGMNAWHGLKVGTAGRLVSHKGIDIFIRAASKIISRYNDVRFFIAGEGPERSKLEFLRDLLGLQERVFFLGNVRQIASFLSELDIFVLASRSEGLSISLLEAGCAGLPLIASAIGGIPEVIQDGKTGLLVPVDDELSLAEAINILINEPEKRKSLGLEAAKDIQMRFTEDNMLKETEKVYDEVFKGRKEKETACFGKSV